MRCNGWRGRRGPISRRSRTMAIPACGGKTASMDLSRTRLRRDPAELANILAHAGAARQRTGKHAIPFLIGRPDTQVANGWVNNSLRVALMQAISMRRRHTRFRSTRSLKARAMARPDRPMRWRNWRHGTPMPMFCSVACATRMVGQKLAACRYAAGRTTSTLPR